jgi:hypothetical protein
MTAGKATALTTAFIGVFALGVAVGPSIQSKMLKHEPAQASVTAQPSTEPAPARAEIPRDVSKPRVRTTVPRKAPVTNAAPAGSSASAVSIPPSEPRLYARLKPVLNRGARMDVASEGFKSAEQFATVAHAARNTDVPFMVLKHRVVTEGRSLEDAIKASKPDLDVKAEVKRAQADAKSDLDAIAG